MLEQESLMIMTIDQMIFNVLRAIRQSSTLR